MTKFTSHSTTVSNQAKRPTRNLLRRQQSLVSRKKPTEQMPSPGGKILMPPHSQLLHPSTLPHSSSTSLQRRAVLLWKWISQTALRRPSQRYSYMPPGFVKVELAQHSVISLSSTTTSATIPRDDPKHNF